MQPIGKYIIVKDIQEELETDSGFLLGIEDKKDLRYQRAAVVASGTEVSGISKDDEIYYDKHQSFKMMIDGEYMTVTQERSVVVVL